MTMKKTYIIPTLCYVDVVEDEQILAGSNGIVGASYDGTHGIEFGDDAEAGTYSDAKDSFYDIDVWE